MTNRTVYLRQQNSLHFLHSLPSNVPQSKLTKADVELLLNKISSSSSSVFKNVVILYANDGHLALGFKKIQDCLRKRAPELSNSYICRLLKAADLYLRLDKDMDYLKLVSESTFRPLLHLSEDQAVTVWQYVLEQHDSNIKITARHVVSAMRVCQIHLEIPQTKAMPVLDTKIKESVSRLTKKISLQISPYAKNESEWREISKLIFQQLLNNCRLHEPVDNAA